MRPRPAPDDPAFQDPALHGRAITGARPPGPAAPRGDKEESGPSILATLLKRIILTALAFTFVLGGLAYIQFDKTMLILRDRSLEDNARAIASYIERTREGRIYLDIPATERQFFATAGKHHQYLVRTGDGQILFTSPVCFIDLYPPDYQPGTSPAFRFTGPGGTNYLGLSYQHRFEGQDFLIQVAQSEEAAEAFANELMRSFSRRLALISLPFIAILVWVIYISLTQSLSSLQRASREASAISFQSPEIRLSSDDLPQEIRPLVSAVNKALERLENGIKAQQEFTANVAHELRTPLSILKMRVEQVGDSGLAGALAADVETMIVLVNQMLDLSKVDFPEALPMEEIRLSDIIRNVCTDIWPLFIRDQRALNVSGIETETMVTGNPDLLYRALRNLLDNALHHSPPGTPVDVHLRERVIEVQNAGPSIPQEYRDRIFRRYQRTDRSMRKPGAGIGLSIVSRIMDIHHGRIIYRAGEGGQGNVFTLVFDEEGPDRP